MATHLGVSVPGLYERAVFAGSTQSAVALQEIVLGMLGARRLLANAANNLNQVARALNSGEDFDDPTLRGSLATFERAIGVLETEIDQLHRYVPQSRTEP